MNRNIQLSFALAFLYHCWFWLGTWVFYYLRFTDYAGIGLIETIMIVASISLEIPTGVFADLFGKKNTLTIAFFLSGLGNLLFGISTSFPMLIASVLTFCIGSACYSGTLEALQFDSLKQIKKEKDFDKVISKTHTLTMIAFTICSVIGGLIYNFWPGLSFIALGIIQMFGALLTRLLEEPKVDSIKFSFKGFASSQLAGLKQLFKKTNRVSSSMLIATGMFFVICSQALNDLLGVEFGFDPQLFGYLSAIFYLLAAIAPQLIPPLRRKFSSYQVAVLVTFLSAISLIVSPILGVISGGIILGFRWMSGSAFDTISSIIVNQNTASAHRATTISTLNMLKNLPYAATAYFLGTSMDLISGKNFAAIMGITMLVVTLYFSVCPGRDSNAGPTA